MNTDKTATIELDVRGLTCPEPVLRTKQALSSLSSGTVTVLTDSPAARDNIVRFGKNAGCAVSWQEPEPGVHVVHITKSADANPGAARTETTLVLTSDRLGQGAEELGRLLAGLLLRTLTESEVKPACLVLMNSGVRLALAGSEVLPALRALEQQGVQIRVCGTCLDFYKVKDQLQIGVVSNFYEAADIMMSAGKVITF
jgi:selenium metabolism protein YedF